MYLGIAGLVALMWIVYDVGTKAGAGKWGLITMMGVLMAAPGLCNQNHCGVDSRRVRRAYS